MIETGFIEFREKKVEMSFYSHSEYISNTLRGGHFCEEELLGYILDNYPDNTGMLDVGANIGNHSVFFANFLKLQNIYAFEPHPMNFELLKHNTERYPNIKIFNFALGEKDRTGNLINEAHNMGGAFIVAGNMVEIKPFDSLGISNISFVNIDVEGFESFVLQGMSHLLENEHPVIFLEATGAERLSSVLYVLDKYSYEMKIKFWDNMYLFEVWE